MGGLDKRFFPLLLKVVFLVVFGGVSKPKRLSRPIMLKPEFCSRLWTRPRSRSRRLRLFDCEDEHGAQECHLAVYIYIKCEVNVKKATDRRVDEGESQCRQ